MSESAPKATIPLTTMDSLIERLKSDKNYKQAIKQGCNNYNISQYKINKIRLEEIPQLVNLIELNYINLEKDSEQIVDKRKYTWLANELKLFVWMAICHSYLSNKPLEEYDEEDWAYFTYIFTRKTSSDLEFQVKSIFKNYHGNKEKWDEKEEEIIKLIIEDDENKNKWNEISRLLYFRSSKKYYRSDHKCREYWFNHLDPKLNKNPWTIDEELRLVKELQAYGFKWSKLTQVIESTWGYRRTQHMVKNRTRLLCKKYGLTDEKEQGCMKELARIEKKLNEQKLKSSQSMTSIKEQEAIDFKAFSALKPQQQEIEQKNPIITKKKKKKQKKQSLSSSQDPESKINLDSQSSQQDFEDVKPKQKKPIKIEQSHNKRNVIILFHANNQGEQQKQIINAPQNGMMEDQEEESPEIMIGQHIEEEIENGEMRQDNQNEESAFCDEQNIVEEVPENANINLNEEMQFQHHTHGGTMRERVTHELAKFFSTPQNRTQII